MTDTKPSLTVSLLETYFETVKILRVYLSEILSSTQDDNLVPSSTDDSKAYLDLINTSYVALKPSNATQGKRLFRIFPADMYMSEVIDRAQEQLFTREKGKPNNVITSGYRLASRNGERGKSDMSRLGITNFFVNTTISSLQASEWETLLQRIGIDAMLHLLTDTSIFVALSNECLCQMTGAPVVHTILPNRHLHGFRGSDSVQKQGKKRKTPVADLNERPTKQLRLRGSVASNAATSTTKYASTNAPQYSPADIVFVRARLFYARPCHVQHTNQIIVGLPPKHILNTLNPSYHRKPKVKPEDYVDPDPRKQADDARHLAKYIFPKQYGLSNPFSPGPRPREEAFKFPDYLDREEEIKDKGPCKTPKRLKDILPILDKLIWYHGKCGYKPLRDKVCPSKIKREANKQLDSSVILEMMSEQSFYPRSQASAGDTSVDSAGPITPRGLSQAQRHVKYKPRFIEFACSHVEVYRYVAVITKAVIPKAFWGCDNNLKLVLKHAKHFIESRRYESLSLHRVLQGFSTAECEWLMPTGQGARQQTRVSVTDSLKRRELLEEFLYWYFDSFLLPLLKTTFYVTDSSAFRKQVLYFRQDDWETLCAPLLERLTTDTFQKLPQSAAEELLRQRKLGYSFVRLLPKDTGVRPVVNLRRRKITRSSVYSPPVQSINQILQAAFHILTYEKKVQPEKLGASVFGPNEMYQKLKNFKMRLPRDSEGNLPKLYFVKLDVQACFDTIEQTKLLMILRELISEDAYMLQRYGQVTPIAGKIRRMYVKKAVPEDEHPHFLTYAAQLADVLRHTIFVDQVVYPYANKQEILKLLEEHITENIVKIGHDYYRQIVGIPQGSVLSTLLCSFFYGDLEKKFYKYTADLQSVLLRLIDDYLFVTTSLTKAQSFLSMMIKGHPEYGCFISIEKTLTNFAFDTQVMNVTEPFQKHFPWCGYLIDMKDLSVSVDYSRYQTINLHDSLTVDRGRRAGSTFVYKMLQLAKAKSHIVYCDSELNIDHVVYLNIYQNFMLSAMKMHGYLRTWGVNVTKSVKFIHNTVRQMFQYTHSTIRNRASNKVAKENDALCKVQKVPVVWLGNHAFHTVLSRKPQKYTSLLKSLAFELSRPQYRKCRKQFRGVVKEGLISMAQISF